MIGVEIERLDVFGLVDAGEPGRLPGIHQVERHLGLAIDRHALAGRAVQIDTVAFAAEGKLDALMHEALAMQPFAGADLIEQGHGAFFQQAGADSAEHIFAGVALKDDVVDAVTVQQLSEQKARRPRTYDGNLCPQYDLPGCATLRSAIAICK